jgi:hypothetical protein
MNARLANWLFVGCALAVFGSAALGFIGVVIGAVAR